MGVCREKNIDIKCNNNYVYVYIYVYVVYLIYSKYILFVYILHKAVKSRAKFLLISIRKKRGFWREH